MKILPLILLVLLAGCASTAAYDQQVVEQQALCDVEAPDLDECLARAIEIVDEEVEYVRQDRERVRYEKLYTFILKCNQGHGTLIYSTRWFSHFELLKMRKAERKGRIYVPKGARKMDFQCGTSQAVGRILQEMMQ